jgi:hypothetical protein
MGGLGNQLFQIFTTISYAIKTNNEYHFLKLKTLGGGESTTLRYTYWDTLLKKLQPILVEQLPEMMMIRETFFEFQELPVTLMKNRNIYIHGYFQSYKYIQQHFDLICKILEIKKQQRKVLEKCELTKEKLMNTISMHFRLGDYKKITHFHPIMNSDYYINSLHTIQKNYPDKTFSVYYFCEDEDLEIVKETIQHCEQTFPNIQFERAPQMLEDWEQMLFMSQCSHNIIANSSFSWWGAYFNSSTEKMVCYPSMWFGSTIENNTKDLCPPEWTKMEVIL